MQAKIFLKEEFYKTFIMKMMALFSIYWNILSGSLSYQTLYWIHVNVKRISRTSLNVKIQFHFSYCFQKEIAFSSALFMKHDFSKKYASCGRWEMELTSLLLGKIFTGRCNGQNFLDLLQKMLPFGVYLKYGLVSL